MTFSPGLTCSVFFRTFFARASYSDIRLPGVREARRTYNDIPAGRRFGYADCLFSTRPPPNFKSQRRGRAVVKLGLEDRVRLHHGVRESGVPRENVFVTTKVWTSDQGYESTLRACDSSLERLGMDYVDLYLIHLPGSEKRG